MPLYLASKGCPPANFARLRCLCGMTTFHVRSWSTWCHGCLWIPWTCPYKHIGQIAVGATNWEELLTAFQHLASSRWCQLKYFWNFHPYLGKISNLTNIFQMGGSTTNQSCKPLHVFLFLQIWGAEKKMNPQILLQRTRTQCLCHQPPMYIAW